MTKLDVQLIDPDVEPAGEKAGRVIRGVAGAIPVVGGAAVELFNSLFEGPLSKRRTEWMVQVTSVLNDLLEKGVVTEEELQTNEAFVSTVAQTCNMALRNHEAEKLEALRNAVKNSVLPSCPADDYRQLFLNFVDACTVTHIKLLHLFKNPKAWIAQQGREFPQNWYMGGLTQVIEFALPELSKQSALYTPIWKDLYQRGLVTTDSLGTTMGVDSMLAGRATPLGAMLIEFLS
ncbi:hypothetical protein NP522_19505 [Pseudomonas guariconensis]|uniref:hypothetical protein n=1 Tax=Pseudomonas guariconensis TaxID=1288410 RepID=UPI0023641866|nr:hypothetical protein [Pseudomonas guariconensis]MDD2092375.1 hypothetical protein [Pseudomonas guariconensis]